MKPAISELQKVGGVVAVGSVPVPALSAHALARLPGNANADPYWRLLAAFLVAYPHHSARAYLGDLRA